LPACDTVFRQKELRYSPVIRDNMPFRLRLRRLTLYLTLTFFGTKMDSDSDAENIEILLDNSVLAKSFASSVPQEKFVLIHIN
jgi:hypothetical protein